MQAVLRFAKYHALGNDFVVVDRWDGGEEITADQAVWLCNRHHGIGGDGVLTLWPDAPHDGRMQIHNSDGSQSAMCGNGLRCLARYLYDARRVPADRPAVEISTSSGVHRCERLAPNLFRVDMGVPQWAHPELPESGPDGRALLTVGERDFPAVVVHFGNPHAVIFVEREDPALLARSYGAAIEHHLAFPERVNVSFVTPASGGFRAVVHERGVGITLACGSGAAAIAASAVKCGLWAAGEEMAIGLPGGTLRAAVGPGGQTFLTGPSEIAFSGEVVWP